MQKIIILQYCWILKKKEINNKNNNKENANTCKTIQKWDRSNCEHDECNFNTIEKNKKSVHNASIEMNFSFVKLRHTKSFVNNKMFSVCLHTKRPPIVQEGLQLQLRSLYVVHKPKRFAYLFNKKNKNKKKILLREK